MKKGKTIKNDMKVLDVGCGARPKGDVNVDLYPNNKQQCKESYNPKRIRNFVIADAENLPFKTKCFLKVYAIHVCEHLKNPFKALHEFNRVGKIIYIRVPSPYDPHLSKAHLYTWDCVTLRNLLTKVFRNVKISYASRAIRFHGKAIPLLRLLTNRYPQEIKAICWD